MCCSHHLQLITNDRVAGRHVARQGARFPLLALGGVAAAGALYFLLKRKKANAVDTTFLKGAAVPKLAANVAVAAQKDNDVAVDPRTVPMAAVSPSRKLDGAAPHAPLGHKAPPAIVIAPSPTPAHVDPASAAADADAAAAPNGAGVPSVPQQCAPPPHTVHSQRRAPWGRVRGGRLCTSGNGSSSVRMTRARYPAEMDLVQTGIKAIPDTPGDAATLKHDALRSRQ